MLFLCAAATSVVLVGKVDETNTLSDGYNQLIYTKDGVIAKADGGGTPMAGKSTQNGWQGTDLTNDMPASIQFDGNSKKAGIRILVNTIDNSVQVMFASSFDDDRFDKTGPTSFDDAGSGGTTNPTPSDPTPSDPTPSEP